MINGVKTNKNQKTMNTEEKEFPDFIENETQMMLLKITTVTQELMRKY